MKIVKVSPEMQKFCFLCVIEGEYTTYMNALKYETQYLFHFLEILENMIYKFRMAESIQRVQKSVRAIYIYTCMYVYVYKHAKYLSLVEVTMKINCCFEKQF